jgi:hypothetical protein
MATETFFSYKNYRWMWINASVLALCAVLYWLDRPIGGRNGGTVLGYSLGALATLGIAYLMWFGMRKRSYHSRTTTLLGCLSAHVWLGLMLIVLVPLHSGFSFGFNVHTLAYALMVLVIVSGLWGAVTYLDKAADIKSHRGGGTIPKLLEQVFFISGDIKGMGKGRSDAFLALMHKVDFEFKPGLLRALLGRRPSAIEKAQMAELLAKLPEKEHDDGLKLISVVNKKREIATQILDEISTLSKMKLWLYVHLPVSFALLVALGAHIFSVFYYW